MFSNSCVLLIIHTFYNICILFFFMIIQPHNKLLTQNLAHFVELEIQMVYSMCVYDIMLCNIPNK